MTTMELDQDAAEGGTSAAADIQLAFDQAMARLAEISQCWEKSSRECLVPAPTPVPASSAA